MKNRLTPTDTPPHRVAALLYDGLCLFEFGIVSEIFGLPRPELGPPLYQLDLVAAEPGPLRARGGLTLDVDSAAQVIDQAQTVIVPGWRGPDEPVPDSMVRILKNAHARGARIMSICSGVFVLAAAGLLDGRRATTHWRYADYLARHYPNIVLETEALFVEDGPVLTSAGSAAGIDACLHVVRQDYGASIANGIAKRLVMHAHREGDQAQFVDGPAPEDAVSIRLRTVTDRIRATLSSDWTLTRMASDAGLSPRTFQRRFRSEYGTSPHRWLISERLDAARLQLETTRAPLDEVATRTGFADAEALRYHFRTRMGLTPQSYRARFAVKNPS